MDREKIGRSETSPQRPWRAILLLGPADGLDFDRAKIDFLPYSVREEMPDSDLEVSVDETNGDIFLSLSVNGASEDEALVETVFTALDSLESAGISNARVNAVRLGRSSDFQNHPLELAWDTMTNLDERAYDVEHDRAELMRELS